MVREFIDCGVDFITLIVSTRLLKAWPQTFMPISDEIGEAIGCGARDKGAERLDVISNTIKSSTYRLTGVSSGQKRG